MAKNKVKISKVEINIGDKTIELSLKEAEELREILNDTFGKTVINNPHQTIIYEQPRSYPWPYQRWEITCNSDTTGANWSSVNANTTSMGSAGGTLSLTSNGAG